MSTWKQFMTNYTSTSLLVIILAHMTQIRRANWAYASAVYQLFLQNPTWFWPNLLWIIPGNHRRKPAWHYPASPGTIVGIPCYTTLTIVSCELTNSIFIVLLNRFLLWEIFLSIIINCSTGCRRSSLWKQLSPCCIDDFSHESK